MFIMFPYYTGLIQFILHVASSGHFEISSHMHQFAVIKIKQLQYGNSFVIAKFDKNCERNRRYL